MIPSSIATLSISLSQPPATRPGFGVPVLFAELTAPQNTAWDDIHGASTRAVEINADSYVATLAELGVLSSEDLRNALDDLFSQDRQPTRALIARRDTPVSQVVTYLIGAAPPAGSYTITLEGDDATYVSPGGETPTQVRDALQIAVELLDGFGDKWTSDTPGVDNYELTAINAGAPFTTSVDSPLDTLTQDFTVASVGLPEDLAALRLERDDFYAVAEVGHSAPDVIALARVVEPLDKIYLAQTNDPLIPVAGSGDAASILGAESLNRTAIVYSSNNDQFVDAALLGQMLPADPGAETWAYQTLRSVVGEDLSKSNGPAIETQLLAKNCTWLESFAALGVSTTREGKVVSGEYLDVIRGRDWIKANMAIDMFELLRGNPRIPYTGDGRALIIATVRARLLAAATAGIIVRDSITISAPTVAEQGAVNKGNRHFPGIKWSATLQGAIHSLDIVGYLVA